TVELYFAASKSSREAQEAVRRKLAKSDPVPKESTVERARKWLNFVRLFALAPMPNFVALPAMAALLFFLMQAPTPSLRNSETRLALLEEKIAAARGESLVALESRAKRIAMARDVSLAVDEAGKDAEAPPSDEVAEAGDASEREPEQDGQT